MKTKISYNLVYCILLCRKSASVAYPYRLLLSVAPGDQTTEPDEKPSLPICVVGTAPN